MRILVGYISAEYSGRGKTELPEYDRIIIEKSDNSVAIHNDCSFKPLNYMTGVIKKTEREEDNIKIWEYFSKTEKLTVYIHKIYDEINISLEQDDPGLLREGTEEHLQAWLANHISELDPTLTFIQREFETGSGPVDILASRDTGALVAVEVKRNAYMSVVGQTVRYMEALSEHNVSREIQGVIAAVTFNGSTASLAAKKNIQCLFVPADWNNKENRESVTTVPVSLFDL